MRIIYVYNKKKYGAIKAAYSHLKLNTDFDPKCVVNNYKKEGYFYYLGIDESLNEVYLLHSKKNGYMLENLLQGFSNLYSEDVIVINS